MPEMTIHHALALAQRNFEAAQHEEAESICTQILSQHPNHGHTLYLMGLIDMQRQRLDTALHWFDKAIASSGVVAGYHSSRAQVLAQLGRNEEAFAAWKTALQIEPSNPLLWFNFGWLLNILGRPDDAVLHYRQALALKPDYSDAMFNLGLSLRTLGKFEEANVVLAEFDRHYQKELDARGSPKPRADIFSHSGDAGDLVFALPAIRAMGGGRLVLYPSADTRERMTPAKVESLRRLLERQPFIKSVEYADKPHAQGFSFDQFRQRPYPMWLCLPDRFLDFAGWPRSERDTKWLDVEPRHIADVVISRTLRYHGKGFAWRELLRKYAGRTVFLGFPSEHEAFCREFGEVPYFPTRDFLQAAEVIAACKLYVGGESMPYAIAEGLKVPCLQEAKSADKHAFVARPGAVCAWNEMPDLPDVK